MIYTIGFTKTSAQSFFERLKKSRIHTVIDVRLNNRSQLAGFAKAPDIQWFVGQLCGAKYIHDDYLAPTEEILKDYQKKIIDWDGYVVRFDDLMNRRNIAQHIESHYLHLKHENICLLCSEPGPEKCHRRLVAECFSQIFQTSITHL